MSEKNLGKCDGCYHRLGELVMEERVGPFNHPSMPPVGSFVFRFYLCRWCRSARTRRAQQYGTRELMKVIESRITQ